MKNLNANKKDNVLTQMMNRNVHKTDNVLTPKNVVNRTVIMNNHKTVMTDLNQAVVKKLNQIIPSSFTAQLFSFSLFTC